MRLYRVEYIEKDVIKDLPEGYKDVARISSPAYTEKEVIDNVKSLLESYKEELKTGKYYILVNTISPLKIMK